MAARPDLAGTPTSQGDRAGVIGAPGGVSSGALPGLPSSSLMEAMVEVVISGRSTPGARLTVAGQPIPAGPDGCFSLRICVPEGQREISLEAIEEATGQEKRINLILGQDVE